MDLGQREASLEAGQLGSGRGSTGTRHSGSCVAQYNARLNRGRDAAARHRVHADVDGEQIERWTSMSEGHGGFSAVPCYCRGREKSRVSDRVNRERKGEGRRIGRSTGRVMLKLGLNGSGAEKG